MKRQTFTLEDAQKLAIELKQGYIGGILAFIRGTADYKPLTAN